MVVISIKKEILRRSLYFNQKISKSIRQRNEKDAYVGINRQFSQWGGTGDGTWKPCKTILGSVFFIYQ